jgi:hypothetical protein
MRKFIGSIVSYILYWLGDLVSRPMQSFDWIWLYPIYNRLMISSILVQDWAKNSSPWRDNNG